MTPAKTAAEIVAPFRARLHDALDYDLPALDRRQAIRGAIRDLDDIEQELIALIEERNDWKARADMAPEIVCGNTGVMSGSEGFAHWPTAVATQEVP